MEIRILTLDTAGATALIVPIGFAAAAARRASIGIVELGEDPNEAGDISGLFLGLPGPAAPVAAI